MPIYSSRSCNDDLENHPHRHFPKPPCVISPVGIGPRGRDGEKGDKGDTFTFDDLTDEQLAELRRDVSTVYYRKFEDDIYTVGDNTPVIAIPFDNYTEHDMLFVNIEGLDLIEGRDYTVDGDHITLILEPIIHSGTRVNFTMLKAIAVSAADLDDFWGDVTEATADARGLMSAADKSKLDSISGDADKVELAQVSAYPGYGRIKVTEKDGTMYAMNVPSLDINGRVKADNLPEGFQSTDWAEFDNGLVYQLSSTNYVRWRAKNGIVFVEAHLSSATIGTNGAAFGAIPSSYKPSREVKIAASTADIGADAEFFVTEEGLVGAKAYATTSRFYASLSYPI